MGTFPATDVSRITVTYAVTARKLVDVPAQVLPRYVVEHPVIAAPHGSLEGIHAADMRLSPDIFPDRVPDRFMVVQVGVGLVLVGVFLGGVVNPDVQITATRDVSSLDRVPAPRTPGMTRRAAADARGNKRGNQSRVRSPSACFRRPTAGPSRLLARTCKRPL